MILYLKLKIIIIIIICLHPFARTGMWGVKLHQHRELVEGLTRAMIMAGQDEEKYTDQTLLDKIVWPSAQYDVVSGNV